MHAKLVSWCLRKAAIGALAFVVATSPFAATVFLRAGTVTKTMPDGQSVTFWGFAQDSAFGAADGTITVPGPRIVVPPGDTTLDVVLDNRLGQPISLVIPGQTGEAYYPYGSPGPAVPIVPVWTDGTSGSRTSAAQRVRSFAPETESGNFALGTGVHYVWSNLKPGTYLYESGTHPSVQVQMGLYGCVTHDFAPGPPGMGSAYSGVSYDNEAVMLFSEVDPALHAAVAGGTYGAPPFTSTMDYEPKYFLINGAAYPQLNVFWAHAPLAGEKLLLRFLNAGSETHVPEVQGGYMSLVSEDGSKYTYPREQYSLVLSAGKTFDALASGLLAGTYALFDRRLAVVNNRSTPGGMITSLAVGQAGTPCPPRVGDTLMLTKAADNSTVSFGWQDIPEATSYRVYESATPVPATFPTLDVSTLTGLLGNSAPMPSGTLVFYLVAGVNSCGEGPQK